MNTQNNLNNLNLFIFTTEKIEVLKIYFNVKQKTNKVEEKEQRRVKHNSFLEPV